MDCWPSPGCFARPSQEHLASKLSKDAQIAASVQKDVIPYSDAGPRREERPAEQTLTTRRSHLDSAHGAHHQQDGHRGRQSPHRHSSAPTPANPLDGREDWPWWSAAQPPGLHPSSAAQTGFHKLEPIADAGRWLSVPLPPHIRGHERVTLAAEEPLRRSHSQPRSDVWLPAPAPTASLLRPITLPAPEPAASLGLRDFPQQRSKGSNPAAGGQHSTHGGLQTAEVPPVPVLGPRVEHARLRHSANDSYAAGGRTADTQGRAERELAVQRGRSEQRRVASPRLLRRVSEDSADPSRRQHPPQLRSRSPQRVQSLAPAVQAERLHGRTSASPRRSPRRRSPRPSRQRDRFICSSTYTQILCRHKSCVGSTWRTCQADTHERRALLDNETRRCIQSI